MNLLKSKEFKEIIKISKKNPNTIALILFGSYAKNNYKITSDLDLCIIRKKNTLSSDFDELNYLSKKIDIVFFDKLPDYIKFRIFSEGKILVLNKNLEYRRIRSKFLHIYRDNFIYRQLQLNKQLTMI